MFIVRRNNKEIAKCSTEQKAFDKIDLFKKGDKEAIKVGWYKVTDIIRYTIEEKCNT